MPEAAAETAARDSAAQDSAARDSAARDSAARDPDAPFVSVRGLARYFDVSKPFLNRALEGAPRLTDIPSGCAFHPRCPKAFERCRAERPDLAPVEHSQAACWLYQEEAAVHA